MEQIYQFRKFLKKNKNNIDKKNDDGFYYYLYFKEPKSNFEKLCNGNGLCIKGYNEFSVLISYSILKYISTRDNEILKSTIQDSKYIIKNAELIKYNVLINPDLTNVFTYKYIVSKWIKPLTYFISGPKNVNLNEFKKHYNHKIDEKIKKDKDSKFIVQDYVGCDLLAQKYLKYKNIKNVIVYHIGESPRQNPHGFQTKSNFSNCIDRDFQMTCDSDEDICWILTSDEKINKYGHNHMTNAEKNVARRNKQ